MEALHQEAVEKCLAGRREAVASMAGDLHERLFALAYQMTADAAVAEDATQEMFFAVFGALKNYDKKNDFLLWAYEKAARSLLDYLRDWGPRGFSLNTSALDQEAFPPVGQALGRIERQRTKDKREILVRALCRLPLKTRLHTCLKLLHDWDYESIAEIAGADKKTVLKSVAEGISLLGFVLRASADESGTS